MMIVEITNPLQNFNPFYDSNVLIAYDDNTNCQFRLVELSEKELIRLKEEINIVLANFGTNGGIDNIAER